MPFVSVTRRRVRSWRYVPGFPGPVPCAVRQAKRTAENHVVWSFAMPIAPSEPAVVWRDKVAIRC
jgi:hypothetical protein